MLIAIMGESFSKNHEIRESKKRLSQLALVVDNWWIDAIPNKSSIVYIVGGFSVDVDDADDEQFSLLNQRLDHLQEGHKKEFKTLAKAV